jgi:hypothetical protein
MRLIETVLVQLLFRSTLKKKFLIYRAKLENQQFSKEKGIIYSKVNLNKEQRIILILPLTYGVQV